jgi:hypothetical protein
MIFSVLLLHQAAFRLVFSLHLFCFSFCTFLSLHVKGKGPEFL